MNDSPFSWMPKAGSGMRIPGGSIFCDQWTVNTSHGYCSGEIIFRFEVSIEEYDKAMKQAQIKENPAIEAKNLLT